MPSPLADLLAACASPVLASAREGEIETYTALAGCLSCGGNVRYPWFLAGMPKDNGLGFIGDTGYCLGACGNVRLVVSRGGLVYRWHKPCAHPWGMS